MFDYDKRSSILLSILAIVLISYAPAHAGGLKVDKRVTLAPTGNTVAGPGIVPALPIGGGDLTIYDNERESNLVGTLHCIQGNMRIFLQATTPGALLKAGDAINGRTIAPHRLPGGLRLHNGPAGYQDSP